MFVINFIRRLTYMCNKNRLHINISRFLLLQYYLLSLCYIFQYIQLCSVKGYTRLRRYFKKKKCMTFSRHYSKEKWSREQMWYKCFCTSGKIFHWYLALLYFQKSLNWKILPEILKQVIEYFFPVRCSVSYSTPWALQLQDLLWNEFVEFSLFLPPKIKHQIHDLYLRVWVIFK